MSLPKLVPLSPQSVWAPVYGSAPSCTAPRFEAAQNVALQLEGDPTSLDVDLGRLAGAAPSCQHYEVSKCLFDVARVGHISFDVAMRGCGDVWACPLWMSPRTWRAPQHRSGEIDFVEKCGKTLNLSFGETKPFNAPWPGKDPANLPPHRVTLDFQADGSVASAMTDLATGQRTRGLHLTGPWSYRAQTAQNWPGNPCRLISDIWNGTAGDGGYWACQGHASPASRCRYTISNLKIGTKDGAPLFAPGSPCACLNAA